METFVFDVQFHQNGTRKMGKISSFLTKKIFVYIMQMLEEISVNPQKNMVKVFGKQCLPVFQYHFLKPTILQKRKNKRRELL